MRGCTRQTVINARYGCATVARATWPSAQRSDVPDMLLRTWAIGLYSGPDPKTTMPRPLALFAFFQATALVAQVPDPSFGGDGMIDVSRPGVNELSLNELVQDAEGRLLVVGFAGAYHNDPTGLVLRFLADGTPDSSFAEDGVWERDIADHANRYFSVAMAPDATGDIIAMGHVTRTPSASELYGFSRIRPDGTPANTVWEGTPGVSLGNCYDDVGYGGRLLPDGRVLLFGSCNEGGTYNAVGVAVTTDMGLTDLTFGTAYTGLDGCCGEAAVDGMVDPWGRIVLAVEQDGGYWAIRFTAAGERDYAFSGSGSYFAGSRSVRRIIPAPGNRLQLIGYRSNPFPDPQDARIIRLTASTGLPDQEFGTDGQRTYRWAEGADYIFTDQEYDPLGRLVLAGRESYNGSGEQGFLARVLPNGDLDSTFGVDGLYRVPHAVNSDPVLALGENGRIFFTSPYGGDSVVVSCYTTDLTTAVPTVAPRKLVQLWPNPATDAVWLEGYHGAVPPIVHNLLGQPQHVPLERVGTGWRLAVQALATGAYVVQVPGSAVRFLKE